MGLLGGTAAAFAITESLKLEKSPILRTRVDKVFSPVCLCVSHRAVIRFSLRKTDDVTVTMVDASDRPVATVVVGGRFRHGPVRLTWDGVGIGGTVVPDGEYWPRVHLAGEHRTIRLPNPIRVDTSAPRVTTFKVARPVVSPDGDRHHDAVVVNYALDGPAHAILYLDGKKISQERFLHTTGRIGWSAKRHGRALPAGAFRLQLAAEDDAGNVGPRTAPVVVTVRYIALPPHRVVVKALHRFHVTVRTDARAYRWKLGKRRGHRTLQHARPARAPEARPVPARGERARARRVGAGRREEAPVTPELARAGAVAGSLGLAVLIAAPARWQRLIGLAALGGGGLALAAYVAPSGHAKIFAAAGVLGLGAAAVGVWLVQRWPWLARARRARLRRGAHPRARREHRLEPADPAVRRRRGRRPPARVAARPRRRAVARARPRDVAARRARRRGRGSRSCGPST